MIRFEIAKLTGSRVIRFLLIALLLVVLLLSWRNMAGISGSNEVEITDAQKLQTDFDSEMDRIIGKSEVFLKDAENTASAFEKIDTYSKTYYQNVIRVYTEARDTVRIRHDASAGWDLFLDDSGLLIISLLFSAAAGALSVCEEKRKGSMLLLFAAKKGRLQTAVSKIAAIGLLSAGYCLVLSFAVVLFYALTGHLGDVSAELQTVRGFLASPYRLSIWQAAVIVTARRLMLCALTGAFFGILSCFFRSYAFLFGTGLLPLISEFVIFQIDFKSVDIFAKNVNVFAVGGSYLLKRYYSVHFFGCADAVTVGHLLFGVLLGAFIFAFVAVFTQTGYLSLGRRSREGRLFKGKMSVPALRARERDVRRGTLFGWEMRKILGRPFVLLLCVACLVLQGIVTYRHLDVEQNQGEEIYRAYCQEYADRPLEEVDRLIRREFDRIQEGIASYKETYDSYYRGEITQAEFEEKWNENGYCLAHELPNRVCMDRMKTLKSAALKDGENVRFVYDSGWNRLLTSDFGIGIVMLIVLCMAGIFSREYETGMSLVLRASKSGGTKTFLVKIGCALAVASVAYVLCAAWELGFLAVSGTFDHPFASVYSLQGAANFFRNTSILSYVMLLFLVRWVAYLLLTLLVVSLSALTKRTLPSILVAFMLVLVPYALRVLFGFPAVFDPSSFMSGNLILLSAESSALAWIPLPVVVLLFVLTAFLRYRLRDPSTASSD